MPVDVTEDFIWVSVRDAGLFVSDSFRQITLSEDQGIHARIGKLKSDPEGSTAIQAYYFDKGKWDTDKAKQWVKDHKKSVSGVPQRRYISGEMRLNFDSGPPKITGYAAVFNQRSEIWPGFYEQVAPGAFEKTVKQDDIRALWNHDRNYVLGRTTAETLSLREDSKGLMYEIIPPDTTWARDLMTLIKRRDVSQSSFGFNIVEQSLKNDKEGKEVTRTLKEVKLFDVSPVTFPAYPQTEVHVRKIQQDKECFWYFEDSEGLIALPTQVESEISGEDPFKGLEELKRKVL